MAQKIEIIEGTLVIDGKNGPENYGPGKIVEVSDAIAEDQIAQGRARKPGEVANKTESYGGRPAKDEK